MPFTWLGWRSLISREALSGSLETFRPFGIGAAKSFSKLKSRTQTNSQPKLERLQSAANELTTTSQNLLRQPRFLVHAGLLVTVGAIMVAAGSVNQSAAALTWLSTNSGAAVMDQPVAATVAASVADRAQLAVAPEASRTATHLKQQINLPTAGANYLAKRAVVQTAGNATRDIQSYTVGGGETLSGIASKFGVTTGTIKWANNLDDADSIKPGQSLVILPVSGILYSVRPGDTADSLAAKYQANAAQILSFNNAEVKGLQAGQKVIIPDGVIEDAPTAQIATSQTSRKSTGSNWPSLTRFSGGANGYSYGYCTYYVAGRRGVPSSWGNAAEWYYNAQLSGFGTGSTPRPGAIAWTGGGYYGHVAYVESASGGMVTVSEMNYEGWNRVSWRTVPASTFRYIY